MLKKSFSVVLGFLLIFMLAACNQTAEPTEGNETTNNPNNETATENTNMTIDELLAKSTEASENINSFTVNMDLKQNMSGIPEVGEMAIDSTIEMEFVTEPIQMYQKMSMNMGEEFGNMETELYFTEDGLFMYDSEQQAWMKFPQEMSEQLVDLTNQQGNPGDELKKLQEFVEDFAYEEDGENYILTLTASGEKLNQFIQETMNSFSTELTGDFSEQDLTINNVEYEIVLSKDTFLPTQLTVVMDLDMTAEGETVHLSQTINGEYTSYNEIENIAVPQEVLDTAVEMNM